MNNYNSFIQALLETMDGKIAGIHTAAPGKIINYSGGLASVQPSIKYKVEDGRVLDAPVIVNVPVYFPTGGNSSITYPIKPGDDCCIVFAERSIDDWLKGATEHPGSWWPDWAKWIGERSCAKVKAPTPGSGKLKVIGDAPGTYVRVKADS